MIGLEQVSLTLGEFSLRDITLRISKGKYLVILGPSGAGKTVLLEVIAGLRIPETGTVTINERDVGGILPEHRGTALVYQDYSLFPHMTAAENVAYGLKIGKRPVHEIRERVDTLLADLGISSLKDRYPGSLSGGEQQRVAIARALATDPSILLLDEPFASLDPRSREECMRVMQKLKDTHSITIIQVSHSGDEAYALADKVAVLVNGRIAQNGTPDEIFCHPTTPEVAHFVGMENILTGTVTSDGSGHSRISFGSVVIKLPSTYPEGARISIGIPAGSIKVVSEQLAFDDAAMNIIPCVVRNVTVGKDTTALRLEGEIFLTVVMRRTDEDGQIPPQGMQVYALVKDTDIRMFSGA
jgi:ABC-type Fe3+/spermidine/putrescine transport system ATPase subunit